MSLSSSLTHKHVHTCTLYNVRMWTEVPLSQSEYVLTSWEMLFPSLSPSSMMHPPVQMGGWHGSSLP